MEADVLRFGEDVVEGVAHFWMNDVVSLVDVMARTGGLDTMEKSTYLMMFEQDACLWFWGGEGAHQTIGGIFSGPIGLKIALKDINY